MDKTSGISHLKQKILQKHGSCSILRNLHIHELFVSENFKTSLPESLFWIEQKYIHDKHRIMTNKCHAIMKLNLKGMPGFQKCRTG